MSPGRKRSRAGHAARRHHPPPEIASMVTHSIRPAREPGGRTSHDRLQPLNARGPPSASSPASLTSPHHHPRCPPASSETCATTAPPPVPVVELPRVAHAPSRLAGGPVEQLGCLLVSCQIRVRSVSDARQADANRAAWRDACEHRSGSAPLRWTQAGPRCRDTGAVPKFGRFREACLPRPGARSTWSGASGVMAGSRHWADDACG